MKKIVIWCSKHFYGRIEDIAIILRKRGFEVVMPNCYNDPKQEEVYRNLGKQEHANFKKRMYKLSEENCKKIDAVLVLNFEKHGVKNYIGGATFLEMYDAFKLDKPIFLYNDIPEGILYDEINGFSPIVINGNLDLIKF